MLILSGLADQNDQLNQRLRAEELCEAKLPNARFNPYDVTYQGNNRWRVANSKGECYVKHGELDPNQVGY